MTALNSGRLVYEGVSFPFGEGTPFALTGFKRGVASARAGDRDRVRADGRAFGRDVKSGPTHDVSLAALGDGSSRASREAAVAVLVGEFERVVDSLPVRSLGGALAQLWIGDRYCLGRPRDLAPDDSGRWDGVAEYGFAFVAESDRWYGLPVSKEIGFTPVVTGGLPIPAAVPFVLGGGGGEADFTVDVVGDVTSWPVFEIAGPITDPYIEVVGVGRLQFRGELAYDQTLEVDTRPWARWVLRNGAAFPGALHPSGARLSDMGLKPGSYQVFFGGYDPSGTSRMTVTVAPAYTSF